MFRVTLAALAMFALAASVQAGRPMTLDDLFQFKRIADPQIAPDGKQVVYQVTEVVDVASNKTQTHLWLAPADGGSPPRQLTASGKRDARPRWSPDGSKLAFESNRAGTPQIFILDLKNGGEAKQLTTLSSGAGNVCWSPDGSKLAFTSAVYPEFSTLPFAESDKKNKERADEIEKNPVKAKVFTRLFYRHWDEYVEDKRQHLYIINLDGTGCHDCTPGDRDAYPTSTTFSANEDFTFSPDGQALVFTAVPAKGESWSTNHDICRVKLDNTSTDWENLTKDNPAADCSPRYSPDGKLLAWRQQKQVGYEADKWNIVVAPCKPDGTLTGPAVNLTANKDVSPNEFVWSAFPDLATGKRLIAFVADAHGWTPMFGVTFDEEGRNATVTEVEQPSGMYGSPGSTAANGKVIVFTQSTLRGPNQVVAVNVGLKKVAVVTESHNKALLDQLELPKPESVTVKIEDGTMQMWVLKPPGFDSTKKYPVAYLVHGGPQGAWEDGWSFRWCPQLWAAQGYVVALPNPRGSTGFGQKFCDEISGDWGGKCYRDLMAGVDHLEKLPYVDKDRIGSAGASFGGYMQDWFAVSTGRFKCLISHCSVWNFESMWGTTDELWFDEFEHGGLPWEIPGKYREFSPHTKAGNLGKFKTPMLVIHNDNDFRCPVGQGIELFTALQRQGVPSKFVNFPDEGHWVLKPANSKYWHQEVFGWLKKYVPPGGK